MRIPSIKLAENLKNMNIYDGDIKVAENVERGDILETWKSYLGKKEDRRGRSRREIRKKVEERRKRRT